MVAGALLGINLLAVAFLVVPGLIGVKLFLWIVRETDHYDRITSLVFSLTISIISVLFLYFAVSAFSWNFLEFSDLQELSLPNIVLLYIIHSVVSLVLGGSLGFLHCYLRDGKYHWLTTRFPLIDEEDSREELWDFTFSEIYSDSAISVVTKNAQIIKGEVVKVGNKVQERDLLITDPSELIRTENGWVEQELPDKTYSYIHNQDISYIVFEEDFNLGDHNVVEKMAQNEPEEIESNPEKKDDLEEIRTEYDAFRDIRRYDREEFLRADFQDENEE